MKFMSLGYYDEDTFVYIHILVYNVPTDGATDGSTDGHTEDYLYFFLTSLSS